MRGDASAALEVLPVVAILRSATTRYAAAAAEVLSECGIRAIEVTMTTDGALDVLSDIRARCGESATVGAGTVRTVADARRAVSAGAMFLVSPDTNPAVLKVADELGVDMLPGALSPTEVGLALSCGAAAVKLFPASLGGPAYVRALLQPMPEARLVPTGGIGLDEVGDYLAAGALGVGLGSPLLHQALVDGQLDELRARARSLVAALAQRELD
jgi:2-dehydro-3-deoxyphosphogluconate aldolase/(4S)-4-hydroxy-2-oxoglutarate aldolase